MDYLQRDSFFTGVAYRFDQTWLLENLGYHVEGDKAFLAIVDRAILRSKILLSRYHMFVSVYPHFSGIETMLKRFYDEAPATFISPQT